LKFLKLWQVGALALPVLVVFAYYAFFVPGLMEYDSYYFLGMVCKKLPVSDEEPLISQALSLVPCDILAVKALLFCMCLFSVLVFAATGRLIDEKRGWMAGFWLFLSYIFFFEFFKFEDDQFSYPFLFLALYFWVAAAVKAKNCEKNAWQQLACLFFCLLACGFWGGSLLFLIVLGVSSLLALTGAGLALLSVFWGKLYSAVFQSIQGVSEATPLLGSKDLLFLLPGLLGWKKERFLLWPGILFALLHLLQPKFGLFAVLFLALGLTAWLKDKAPWHQYFLVLASVLVLGSFVAISMQPPSLEEHQSVQYAVMLACEKYDCQVMNDWQLGHIVKWYGGKTCYFGSPCNCCNCSGDCEKISIAPGILVSESSQSCTLLKEWGKWKVYEC